ncbi:hypothetical protein ABZ464_17500 [Streptomyces sp. NPDC005820]
MADDDAQGFQAGQSRLIVRVPEALALARLAARADAGDFDVLLEKENYRR